LIVWSGTNNPVEMTPDLEESLLVGGSLVWDNIFSAMNKMVDGTPITDTSFYRDLPRIAQPRLSVGLCRNFLHSLDVLMFKLFCPQAMAIETTAEELLLHWIIVEAKASNDITEHQEEEDLDTYHEAITDDFDVFWLYRPAMDGIENVPELNAEKLKYEKWFLPSSDIRMTSPFTWE